MCLNDICTILEDQLTDLELPVCEFQPYWIPVSCWGKYVCPSKSGTRGKIHEERPATPHRIHAYVGLKWGVLLI